MCTVEQSLQIVVEKGGAYNVVNTDGFLSGLLVVISCK